MIKKFLTIIMEYVQTDSFNIDVADIGDVISSDNERRSEVRSLINTMSEKCALINHEEQVSALASEITINPEVENTLEINFESNEKGSCGEKICEQESINFECKSNEFYSNTEATTRETFAEATQNEDQVATESHTLCYEWGESPILLCSATEEYKPTPSCENFTKGCQWSPDGTCLLVPAEDFRIRVYDLPRELYSGKLSTETILPSLKPALFVKEGGVVYDSCWFPMMNSWDPSTCCFATTSKESPVHLWDAFNGELRATYRAYNQVDEVEAAISVQFVNSGAEVWCGFKGALRTFDTGRPGRQVNTITLKKDIPNITGIVSCIRENPTMPGLVAFGTYSKTIGLYKDGPLCALGTGSGVTQIEFSPCGMKLYSAVRRNNEMLCWDLRNPGTILYSIQGRQADTNQRIQFSVSPDGTDLVSGGTDGSVSVWRQDENNICDENLEIKQKMKLSVDCINGVSLHKSLPIMASSSGQRICEENDAEEGEENGSQVRDNSVRFWWCGPKL